MILMDVFVKVLIVLQYVVVVVIFFKLLMDNRPPEVLFAWSFILLILPLLGIIIYFFAGIDWRKRRIMKKLPEEYSLEREHELLEHQYEVMQKISNEEDSDSKKAIRLLLKANNAPLTMLNTAHYFFDGKDFFDDLIARIEGATHSICMQFYIWRNDKIGNKIFSLLEEKARAGVEVALIFDGVGCMYQIPRRRRKKLELAGIKYKYFMDPNEFFKDFLINYRNHRKIVVIDDRVAYTGGFNVGDEYISGGEKFQYWRDSAVRVEGEAVPYFKDIFLAAWKHSGGIELRPELPPILPGTATALQVASSGPDSKWFALEKLFLTIIINANEKVYIQSPYFVPDHSMLTVLETAALTGIDVRLMVAGVPDKKIPYWVAETYFEPLVKAGVKIYRYEKGFLHAKTIVVDDQIASLGSCNFDIRSFRLAYESNVVIYDPIQAKELANKFIEDIEDCRLVNSENLKKYSFIRRLRNSVARIFAPIL